MNEFERFKQWMEDNGYEVSSLADALGMEYHAIYMAIVVRRRISDGMKLRFAQRFGWTQATAIFDLAGEQVAV